MNSKTIVFSVLVGIAVIAGVGVAVIHRKQPPSAPSTQPEVPVTATMAVSGQSDPKEFNENKYLDDLKTKLNTYKQTLCGDDLHRDLYDLAANNLDGSKILLRAICAGEVPGHNPQIEAISSSMVHKFVARIEAEVWLRSHDPTFKSYERLLDAGLSSEFDEDHLFTAIQYLDFGNATKRLSMFRPSDIQSNSELRKKYMDLQQRISANQHIVIAAAPVKLLTYMRLSRDQKLPEMLTKIDDKELGDYNEDNPE